MCLCIYIERERKSDIYYVLIYACVLRTSATRAFQVQVTVISVGPFIETRHAELDPNEDRCRATGGTTRGGTLMATL